MAGADDAKFEFTKLLDGVAGAEGPVFDIRGNFYMVGPEIEKDNKFAGQILKVDLTTRKVCYVDGFVTSPNAPLLRFSKSRSTPRAKTLFTKVMW